jgi:hypothetical protein
VELLDIALSALRCSPTWAFQSHLDGGHATVAVSDKRSDLSVISHRLAMMVEELGGDVYLSGPSGHNYLDETPFSERGIAVEYWRHEGPTSCILELCADAERVAA